MHGGGLCGAARRALDRRRLSRLAGQHPQPECSRAASGGNRLHHIEREPNHPAIRATLRSIGRLQRARSRTREVTTFTSVEIRQLLSTCDDDLAGVWDRVAWSNRSASLRRTVSCQSSVAKLAVAAFPSQQEYYGLGPGFGRGWTVSIHHVTRHTHDRQLQSLAPASSDWTTTFVCNRCGKAMIRQVM